MRNDIHGGGVKKLCIFDFMSLFVGEFGDGEGEFAGAGVVVCWAFEGWKWFYGYDFVLISVGYMIGRCRT